MEAGADVLFIEAPQTRAHLEAIVGRFGGRIPLMANMVEGGKTPIHGTSDLETLGFSLVIFPGGVVRAMAKTAGDYYRGLISTGSNEGFRDRMYDFAGLNEVIGTSEMLKQGDRYGD